MDNKKKIIFIPILVILVVVLSVLAIYYINNTNIVNNNQNETGKIENNKEETYENEDESNIEGVDSVESDGIYEMGQYGDITIEGVEKDDGSISIRYTRNDAKSNVIWSYETKSEIPAQCNSIGTIEITEDRIYLHEFGKIILLNRENGKIIWEQDNHTVSRFTSWHLDEEYNLYIIGDSGVLSVIDKDGKIKGKIENIALCEEMLGEGFCFNFINDNELLLEGIQRCIFINLKNYSIKEIIDVEFSEDDMIIIKKINGTDKVIWEYKTDGYIINPGDIIQDKLFIHESGKIVVLNVKTGKVVWKNSDYKEEYYPKYCVDYKGNIYLCTYDNPNLLIIDNKGKTVLKIDSFNVSLDEYESVKTLELRNEEKELVIKCDTFNVNYKGFILEKSAIVINLEDYSIKYENIEE